MTEGYLSKAKSLASTLENDGNPVSAKIVRRLLEERESLLAACKAMRATMHSPDSEVSRLADAAIEKSETWA